MSDNKPYFTLYPPAEKFEEALKAAPPLFMFTMGKVASKTIGRSLEGVYPGVIIHGHMISDIEPCRPGQIGPDHMDERFVKTWDWCVRKGNPARVIAPVRESADRNVSDFFHNFHKLTKIVDRPVDSFTFEEQLEMFNRYEPHLWHTQWFQTQLFKLTGWNVYAESSGPPNGGWWYGEKNNWEILVFQTELPDSEKEHLIGGLLKLEQPFKLKPSNTASEKSYFKSYQDFRARFNFEAYREPFRELPYWQFFYGKNYLTDRR